MQGNQKWTAKDAKDREGMLHTLQSLAILRALGGKVFFLKVRGMIKCSAPANSVQKV